MLVPLNLVFVWLTGLLSLALLGGGAWLVWEWYDNWARDLPADPRFLAVGLLLLAFTLCGRLLVVPLLGRRPPPGEEEPRALPGGTVRHLSRPDGTVLHVESHGPPDAPALLFTHGWGLNRDEWFYARRHLADRFCLVMWDLPGLGQSRGPADHQYDLTRLAGDLKAVLEREGKPVILCGHSIGGMITLTLCGLDPGLVSRHVAGLVLIHTTATNPMRTSWGAPWVQTLQTPLVRPLCALTILLSPLVRVMNGLSYLNGTAHLQTHLMQFGGQETRGQLEFVVRLALRANPAVVARGMLAMLRYDVAATLPTIAVPTLVVAASGDKATLPEASSFIAQNVPHAREVVLSPAGHLGLMEQHREWAEAVADFAERTLATSHRS
ncbi:alpha/beta fold hydrolase [Deinococcus planocerae]|uniref:alpha/beta fold hydrolase n=1 Tax=Deinococcus planocerae TaxID=1737569 RepID=UPI000C7EDAA1|nr:alpha/beta hydrolase [Deinococcus planocerae]